MMLPWGRTTTSSVDSTLIVMLALSLKTTTLRTRLLGETEVEGVAVTEAVAVSPEVEGMVGGAAEVTDGDPVADPLKVGDAVGVSPVVTKGEAVDERVLLGVPVVVIDALEVGEAV